MKRLTIIVICATLAAVVCMILAMEFALTTVNARYGTKAEHSRYNTRRVF